MAFQPFKKIKENYQKLDTKLGGILPGKGNEQTQAAPASAPVAPTENRNVFQRMGDNFKTNTDKIGGVIQKARDSNVGQVLRASTDFNPDTRVNVNLPEHLSDNPVASKVLDKTLGFVANNPYDAAGILTGVSELGAAARASSVAKTTAAKTVKPTANIINEVKAADTAFLGEGATKSYNLAKFSKSGTNSKSARTASDIIKGLFISKNGTPKLLGIGLGTIVASGLYGITASSTKLENLAKNSPADIQTLREAGMHEEADAMQQDLDAIADTTNAVLLAPIYGRSKPAKDMRDFATKYATLIEEAKAKIEADEKANEDFVATTENKIKNGIDVSDEDLAKAAGLNPGGAAETQILLKEQIQVKNEAIETQNTLITKMVSMSDEQILSSPEILAAVNDPVNADSLLVQLYIDAHDNFESARQEAQKQEYAASVKAEQRAYNEAQRDEQRAYNEQQQAIADQQQFVEESTATENSGASTLNFGILGSSGEVEFVDRDAASNVYFGKVFEELTPAQKKLLMLSKGK